MLVHMNVFIWQSVCLLSVLRLQVVSDITEVDDEDAKWLSSATVPLCS